MRGIEHLSSEKLAAVLQTVTAKLKDSRKKAGQLISKETTLSNLWVQRLSGSQGSPEEIKQKRVEAFEAELLEHPEAFIHYSGAPGSLYPLLCDDVPDRP